MSLRVVLFDVDGTLLDVAGSGRWAMTRAFEEVFDIPDATPFAASVRFDGMTDRGIQESISRNASIDPDLFETLRPALRVSFLGHLQRRLATTEGNRVLPGVTELLDRLSGVSMARVGLATGNIEAGARLKLAACGLSGYFETGGFGDDAPDRAGLGRIALERVTSTLGEEVLPADVVLVGDSEEDILAARTNGYRVIAVGTGWTDHERLRAHEPDLFVADLSDFGGIMQFIFGTNGTKGTQGATK